MNIFIGSLSFKATENDLREAFEAFGEVSSASIITDRETGRSKGFAFVEMPNQAEAEEAVKELNGKEIAGRAVVVNEARPRENKPRRNNGGFRGRDRRF